MTEDTIANLEALRSLPKFSVYPPAFYPAATNEVVRSGCEARVDELIGRLIDGVEAHPTSEFVLSQVRITLGQFEKEDSEEQDRLLWYIEDILDILGIESTDGLLNEWRYGFDPDRT